MFKLLAGFSAPLIDYPFPRSDVAMYAATLPPHAGAAPVDRQTWDDLLLDQYADRLARGTSIFGQQELHRRLLGTGSGAAADVAATAATAARVRALAADGADPHRAALQTACVDLRCAETEIAGLLFGAGPAPAPRWSRLLKWLPPAFLLSAALVLLWWPLCVAALVLWVLLMLVQVKFYEQSQRWEQLVGTLQLQLRAHSLLGALAGGAGPGAALAAPFRDGAAQAGKLSRQLGRSSLESVIPGLKEYGEWIGLSNIRRYFAGRDLFLAHRAFLRDSYRMVAGLDADLALARELRAAPVVCWATQPASAASPAAQLQLDGLVHPLLDQAMPLTITLEGKGAFISGQNGIGKSTLLRTLGLNLITARAFGFCYARSASVPLLPVYSSMQSEDSLAGGESLYIAELRRAHELLALAGQGRAVFLIDEIFRGTNHLESVSGAAAVLDTLAQQGTVLVSSHNLVLAPLLAHRLAPLCVSAEGGQLRVRPGVLAHTNGLTLLAQRGFGSAIEAKAAQVHAWLGNYLAHPDDCGHVLRAA
ncbi:DNA mismatch repair protein MutS [Massilia sp. Root351]|uniref:MutS-related protein n=1 Tax=Massilia sp. Root351 TaxID=1736522 RepID=UPI0009EB2C67|nr:DNA mismatch repair protein MutS [Massilia sp. Root351]